MDNNLLTNCKHSVMHLDSVMSNLNELREYESLNNDERELFANMAETAGDMMARITNLVSSKTNMSEEEFLKESIDIDDDIDSFNILDEEI